MKCLICSKKFNRRNNLKIHILKLHLDGNTLLYCETIFIKSVIGIDDFQINQIKNEYLIGYTIQELKEKYYFDFSVFIILSGIKRTASESKKTEMYQKKLEKTVRKKYGVGNISQSNVIKNKKKKTFLKHHGYENNFCNNNIRTKARKNIDYVLVWKKVKQTLKEKYGVENMSQTYIARNKISERAKTRMSLLTSNERRKITENARKNIKNISGLETRIQLILNVFNIEYKANIFLYGYNFDLLFKHKIILEVQGDYWHANPSVFKKNDIMFGGKKANYFWKKDEKKKRLLERKGYKVLYLWEKDLRKMSDEQVIIFLKDNLILCNI